jgi:glycosyltransferase involved in cell wall biosynthesis
MNIAMLHYAVLPVVGGVELVVGQHACLMVEDGHQVTVIAGRGGAFDPRINFVRLPVADSRHPAVLNLKSQLDQGKVTAEFNSLVDSLVKDLIRFLAGIDLLIAHNVCSLHKNLALTAAVQRVTAQARAPHLILWHHDLAWSGSRYQAELHPGYPWDLLRNAWTGATQVAVSELRRQELVELTGLAPDQIRVIPNGLDLNKFLKLEAQTRNLVSRLNLLEAYPLLLLPVRLTRRKNIELALRILAVLKDTYPQAALVVTGPPGPHNPANAAYLEDLLKLRAQLGLGGAAHFLAELNRDYLPDAVIADLYRLADALLLPSREEGFGIPLLEAGLARLPIFCTDIPPLRALADSYADLFSPEAEPEDVAQMIVKRLSADSESAFRAQVRMQFSWERIYQQAIKPLLEEVSSQ